MKIRRNPIGNFTSKEVNVSEILRGFKTPEKLKGGTDVGGPKAERITSAS